jgi:hypothetical protein
VSGSLNDSDWAPVRFEVELGVGGDVTVTMEEPCDRAEVRELCVLIAQACGGRGHPDVTFREPTHRPERGQLRLRRRRGRGRGGSSEARGPR